MGTLSRNFGVDKEMMGQVVTIKHALHVFTGFLCLFLMRLIKYLDEFNLNRVSSLMKSFIPVIPFSVVQKSLTFLLNCRQGFLMSLGSEKLLKYVNIRQ